MPRVLMTTRLPLPRTPKAHLTLRALIVARLSRRAKGRAAAAAILGRERRARVLADSLRLRAIATVIGRSPRCKSARWRPSAGTCATPAAEMPPALLVHDAVAQTAGPGGGRSLPLSELFAGPGRTTLEPGELLTAVSLRVPATAAGSCYLRQTVRWSMDLAGVGVAAAVEVAGTTVTRARIALGAVAPVPLLVGEAAEAVVGTALSAEDADRAGACAAAACSPISDARGTAEYRRQVVAVLVPRALRVSWLRATGSWPAGMPAPINGVLASDAP
jgi:CO/xanthine dehydrogenase FAD-binding subunit